MQILKSSFAGAISKFNKRCGVCDLALEVLYQQSCLIQGCCKSAGCESGLQSVKSTSALQAELHKLQADIEQLHPIGTAFRASCILSDSAWKDVMIGCSLLRLT